MGDYSNALVKHILQRVSDDLDFELFCVRHYSHIEGITYLPTSRNYDLGRDGRARVNRQAGESYIVSSIQENRITQKAMRDLKKLLKHDPRPAKVIFCFTEVKTETVRSQIERDARQANKAVAYEVKGIDQIVEEVHRHSAAFEETYEHVLDEARRQLDSVDRSPQTSIRLGLRVLLATQLDQNAVSLRQQILSGLVLQATKRNMSVSREELSRAVADAIGINRPVEASYLAETLRHLCEQGARSKDAFKRLDG